MALDLQTASASENGYSDRKTGFSLPQLRIFAAPVQAELCSAVAALEALCFDRPWGADELRSVLAESSASLACLLAPPATAEPALGSLLAYCLYQTVLDECEVLQLATAPMLQRQGLGRWLMEKLLFEMRQKGAHAVFLEVRRSNVAARALYEGLGFALCGLRRGYYFIGNQSEDALVLRRDLQ